jgi:energy-coupling factor transporter ATP-binding protein EcfA2
MDDAPVVALRDVSFTYRAADAPALDGVSFALRRGEFAVLMGATGAGKSTLAKILNRSIPQFQPGVLDGEVRVLGRALDGCAVSDLAGQVGFVSQDFEAQLFATNVRQEVAFGLEQLGVAPAEIHRRIDAALGAVGLRGFEPRDPSTLSGGEKQRLALAAMLALDPAVLVLDEPTTDLDPLGKAEVFAVLAALRRAGRTILLIEHETEAATHADRVIVLDRGRIVDDAPPARLLPDVARLEHAGIRPLDLDRIGAACRWTERASTVEDAAVRLRLRERGTACTGAPGAAAAIVALERVDYAYGDGPGALHGVSLTIGAGELIAVIGQNGSGKTTLAKCLNGLIRPQRGRVVLHGMDVAALPLDRVAGEIGYVFQNPDHQIFAATVGEEVAFGLRNFGTPPAEVAPRVAAALAAVGLDGSEALDPFLLGKGQRQRLAVASLLALRPSVLILDEPTTGLDHREQRQMMTLIADLHRTGMTIVVITHTPWVVAEYAHRGVLLEAGRVAFDGPLRVLFADEPLLTRGHFRIPDATRLGRRLGISALSVGELLAAVEPVD